ncbi:MAG: ATP-binding cassette domain-containing protein [Flavobacteriaceae bacterium]|nr:ATP-binding cassette domain-containing protein [Flavobacteriaceae bacterium]
MFPLQLQSIIPKPLEGLYGVESIWGKRLELAAGSSYLIKAASGKGKSTLLAYLMGLRSDYFGELLLDGKPIQQFSPSEIAVLRANEIAYLPQDLRLFVHLTALENIQLTGQVSETCSKVEMLSMAAQLGIAEKMNSPCGKLSFGQQQRVALVRALCRPFKLLLLDEPFSHLDDDNIGIAKKLIEEAVEKNSATLLLTSLGSNFGFQLTQILTV